MKTFIHQQAAEEPGWEVPKGTELKSLAETLHRGPQQGREEQKNLARMLLKGAEQGQLRKSNNFLLEQEEIATFLQGASLWQSARRRNILGQRRGI